MSIRSTIRVGEELKGAARGERHLYRVLGGVFLAVYSQSANRLIRQEQWRLIDENHAEIWVEVDCGTNKVFLHEPIRLSRRIDPRRLSIGQVLFLRIAGVEYSATVIEVGQGKVENAVGTTDNSLGSSTRTAFAELRVEDAFGNVGVIVVDHHRHRFQQAYGKTEITKAQQIEMFGKRVQRHWWEPSAGLNRNTMIGALKIAAIVLLLLALMYIEWVAEGETPFEGGGTSYHNRSVYGGGGGGVGK